MTEITQKLGPLGSQLLRVIDRFALAAAAGELASESGITGWSKDEAINSTIFMAKRYFEQRGTIEDTESQRIVRCLYSKLMGQPKRFPYPFASSLMPAHYMSQENVVGQLGYRLPKDEMAFLNHLNSRVGEDFGDSCATPSGQCDLGVYYLTQRHCGLFSIMNIRQNRSWLHSKRTGAWSRNQRCATGSVAR